MKAVVIFLPFSIDSLFSLNFNPFRYLTLFLYHLPNAFVSSHSIQHFQISFLNLNSYCFVFRNPFWLCMSIQSPEVAHLKNIPDDVVWYLARWQLLNSIFIIEYCKIEACFEEKPYCLLALLECALQLFVFLEVLGREELFVVVVDAFHSSISIIWFGT